MRSYSALALAAIFTGVLSSASCAQPNLVKNGDAAQGFDCGTKATAAFAAGSGEVQESTLCGAFASPLVLGNNQHLYLMPGVYPVSSTITLAGVSASIECSPAADVPNTGLRGVTSGSCTLQAVGGGGLATVVLASGQNAVLSNVKVDANGAGATNAITIHSVRARLDHTSAVNASSGAGFVIGCTDSDSGNCAAATKLDHVMALNNGTGLACHNTSDLFITASEFENNLGSGTDLQNCGGFRFTQDDWGGNGSSAMPLAALYLHGDGMSGSIGSGSGMLNGSQFGNNYAQDIRIDGFDPSTNKYVATSETITGNQFEGGGRRPDNAYDAILVVGGGLNTIVGNSFTSTVGSRFLNAYEGQDYTAGGSFSAGFLQMDTIVGNTVTGAQGTGCNKQNASQTVLAGLNNCFQQNQQNTVAGMRLQGDPSTDLIILDGTGKSVIIPAEVTTYLKGNTVMTNNQTTSGVAYPVYVCANAWGVIAYSSTPCH